MLLKFEHYYQNMTTENPKLNKIASSTMRLDLGKILPSFNIKLRTIITTRISMKETKNHDKV